MLTRKSIALVGVLIVLVLGGTYAGKVWVEGRVTAEVRTTLQNMRANAESVTFTLPSRMLSLRGLTFAPQPGLDITSFTVAAVDAVLPWKLLFAYQKEGPQLLAETCTFSDITLGMQQSSIKVGRGESVNVVQDLALAIRIASAAKPTATDLAAQSENSAFDRAALHDISIELPEAQASIRMGSLSYTDVKGGKIGAIQLDKLEGIGLDTDFADTVEGASGKPVTVITLGMARIAGVDIPGNALRLFFEMDPTKPLDPEWADQTFMPTLFGGKHPLFARFELHDLRVPVLYDFSLREYVTDWTSVVPMRSVSRLTGASLPLKRLLEQTDIQVPQLEALQFDNTVTFDGQADGAVNEHITFTMPGLCDIDLKLGMQMPADIAGGTANLWNYDLLDGDEILLRSLELSITDKNLLAYVLYNLQGPQTSAESFIDMLPSTSATDEAAYTRMIDAVGTFVSHPGTLTVRYSTPKPTPIAELWPVLLDPAQLSFTAVPGPRSFQDVLDGLYGKK